MAHPKGLLIERAQKLGLDRPEFNTAKAGPEHEPSFLTDVTLAGEVIGTGQGRSKRDSEKAAAEEALATLSQGAPAAGSGSAKTASRKAAKGTAKPQPQAARTNTSDDADDGANGGTDEDGFQGPWPMFDDLLASVVQVAERRVSADLRGSQAMESIRDFSLQLYKELLADLGEVVEEDEDDEDD